MTQARISVEVHGMRSTLQYLRRFEPEVYKQVTADMRKTAAPLRATVAKSFPAHSGVERSSGVRQWAIYGHASKQKKRSDKGESGYSFPRYDITQVRRGVKTQIGGRKNRLTNEYPILRIKQTDGAGVIYDMAQQGHSAAGRAFVKQLDGKASRVMWPTMRRAMPGLRREIERTIAAVERRFSAQIASDMDYRAGQSAGAARQARNALGQFGARF